MTKPILSGAALASARNSMVKAIISGGLLSYDAYNGRWLSEEANGYRRCADISSLVDEALSVSYKIVEK